MEGLSCSTDSNPPTKEKGKGGWRGICTELFESRYGSWIFLDCTSRDASILVSRASRIITLSRLTVLVIEGLGRKTGDNGCRCGDSGVVRRGGWIEVGIAVCGNVRFLGLG